ncbi:MAG: hypothetical protein EHM32_02515 [Spirochaetales bacterium]|nr:MAG: hypothetical protein EHM32_02515 [Spirochaetales bacterium]
MKETAERTARLGFTRNPKKVVDEVERITAEMIREGWKLRDTIVEESLGNIHLFFERDVRSEP